MSFVRARLTQTLFRSTTAQMQNGNPYKPSATKSKSSKRPSLFDVFLPWLIWFLFLVVALMLTTKDQPVPVEPSKLAILKYCSLAMTFAILSYASCSLWKSPYRHLPQCVVGYIFAVLVTILAQVAIIFMR